MVFFDLNIPYHHESEPKTTTKSSVKATRLKLAVKAMELGYSGVAYNRTTTGVMSESHRCSTPLFPLSSFLGLSPSLSSAVSLRRRLLGVPASAPFRQYTRLTVTVDSSSQASALNSGNPVLKGYDIVAVRPMNQSAFEQACRISEVDLISIDFSEKLPFRLKQPMVKAAIERGIYFEITYSALIMDVQVRRQMISSAKLLVDWTRGKNLIISSAAPSVMELRGPFDVANLSFLFGLSMEQAKAAVSTNCRSLIAKAVRKKHYYKEAVRVEIIPSREDNDSKELWPSDWMKWDPISSGEGDLLLDDLAKSFSATNKTAKTAKCIDFSSIMNNPSSGGLQLKDIIPVKEAGAHPLESEILIANTGSSKVAASFLDHSKTNGNLFHACLSQHQSYSTEESTKLNSSHGQRHLSNDEKNLTNFVEEEKEQKTSYGFGVDIAPVEKKELFSQSQNFIRRCDTQVGLQDHCAIVDISLPDTVFSGADEAVSDAENITQPMKNHFPLLNMEESKISSHVNVDSGTQDDEMTEVSTEMNTEVDADLPLPLSESEDLEKGQCRGIRDVPDAIVEPLPVAVLHNETRERSYCNETKEVLIVKNTEIKGDLSQTSLESNGLENDQLRETRYVPAILTALMSQDEITGKISHIIANCEPLNEVAMKEQNETENEVAMEEQNEIEDPAQSSSPDLSNSSGKRRVKPRTPHQAFFFPFKRLSNRAYFKRKAHKHKTKTKLL